MYIQTSDEAREIVEKLSELVKSSTRNENIDLTVTSAEIEELQNASKQLI